MLLFSSLRTRAWCRLPQDIFAVQQCVKMSRMLGATSLHAASRPGLLAATPCSCIHTARLRDVHFPVAMGTMHNSVSMTTAVRCLYHRHPGESGIRRRAKDGVPDNYDLVYAAGMDWYVRICGAFTLAPLPLVVLNIPKFLSGEILAFAGMEPATLCFYAGVYAFVTSSMVILMRRYVFRMYYCASKRTYIAVLAGSLGLNVRLVELRPGDVKEHRGIFHHLPWNDMLFKYNGGKMILYDSAFKTGADFNRLLGYKVNGEENS